MKKDNMKNYRRKLVVLIVCICAVELLSFGALMLRSWAMRLARMTYYGNCENGLIILHNNPGAFSSTKFEVRDGLTVVEKGLRSKQIDEFAKNNNCRVFSNGG